MTAAKFFEAGAALPSTKAKSENVAVNDLNVRKRRTQKVKNYRKMRKKR